MRLHSIQNIEENALYKKNTNENAFYTKKYKCEHIDYEKS